MESIFQDLDDKEVPLESRYAKRKHDLKSGKCSLEKLGKTISGDKLVLHEISKACASIPSSIACSLENFEFYDCDNEYNRFILFTKSLPADMKDELNQLLYPMFVYIYVTLLQIGKYNEAEKFFSCYANLFGSIEGYSDKIKALFQLKTYEELINNDYFKLFWEHNYIIQLTEENLKKLKDFLKDIDSKVLLPLLHSHFFIEGQSESTDFHLDCLNAIGEELSEKSNGALKNEAAARKLAEFKNIIQSLSEEPLYPPPTYFHFIESNEHNLTSASLNLNNSYLAGGFEDSSIHVWSISDCFSESETADNEVSSMYFSLNGNEKNFFHSSHNTSQKSKALRGHYGSVYGLSWTPCHDFLVSCSEDTTVRLWNLKTSENVALYSGHHSPVWDIDVSPTCSFFATASMDLTSRLWSFDRDSPVRIFVGHQSDVERVRFHPNEHYIATSSSDGMILLWTVMDAIPVRSLGGHMFNVMSIAFSNNGKYLASGDIGGNIKIWDIASGLEIQEFCGHTSRILNLCFNYNDSALVSCGMEKGVKLWDVRNATNGKRLSTNDDPCLVTSHKIWAVPHLVQYTQNGLLTVVANVDSDTKH